MGLSTALGKIVLLGLAATGVMAAKAFLYDNGLIESFNVLYSSGKATLPGTRIPLQTKYTGNEDVDKFMSLFVFYFWPASSGGLPQYSLQGIHMVGQLVSAYFVILIEAFRVGNSWRLISFAALWMLFAENIGAMVFLPTWALLHLLTSPTVSSSTPTNIRRTSLLVHPVELKVLPWAVLIGSYTPAALGSAFPPEPQANMLKSGQTWTVLRQYHPLYTATAHLFLSVVCHSATDIFTSPGARNRHVARGLRNVYSVARYVSMVTHLGSMSISLASLIPNLLNVQLARVLQPAVLYTPVRFWEGVSRVKDITREVGPQAFAFVQWDEIIVCVSMLVWAFAINRDGLGRLGKGSDMLSALIRVVVLTAIGGPMTAAISLLQERDEAYLDGELEEDSPAQSSGKVGGPL